MDIDSSTKKQLVVVFLVVVGLSLLFRLSDMLLSGMNWGGEDYVAAAALLGGSGVLFVLLSQKISDLQVKRRLALRIAFMVVLGWVLLATEFDGFNF